MELPRPRRDSLTTNITVPTPTTSASGRRSGLLSTPSTDIDSGSEAGGPVTTTRSAATTPSQVPPPPPSAPPVQPPPPPPTQLYSMPSISGTSCVSGVLAGSTVLSLSTYSDVNKIVSALLDPE